MASYADYLKSQKPAGDGVTVNRIPPAKPAPKKAEENPYSLSSIFSTPKLVDRAKKQADYGKKK